MKRKIIIAAVLLSGLLTILGLGMLGNYTFGEAVHISDIDTTEDHEFIPN